MKNYNYPRIPQTDYEKAIGQLRLQLAGVFHSFDCHGLGILIPGAIEECVNLAEQFSMRTRGKNNQMIKLKNKLPPKPTE